MMQTQLQELIHIALSSLQHQGELPDKLSEKWQIMQPQNPDHGDWACNVALVLAKQVGQAPKTLASAILKQLPQSEIVASTTIAGPGFINFFLSKTVQHQVLQEILQQADQYGCNNIGLGQKVLLEFVSANPTGPLHVGHGRGAAYGDILANILRASGYDVFCEYYINDAGRQMHILAISIWIRYLSLQGTTVSFPEKGYRGKYVKEIAQALHDKFDNQFFHHPESWPKVLTQALIQHEPPLGPEQELDAWIELCKQLLDQDYHLLFSFGCDAIVENIKADLAKFNIHYQNWFSEQSLLACNKSDKNKVMATVNQLRDSHHIYEHEGALWFRATDFGDDKDRVVVRDNGQPTYFATDIAYHVDKFNRGFNQLINIWGADHHGYVKRLRSALIALGYPCENFNILLVQFATLFAGTEKLSMSTRAGEFVCLEQLRNEVGTDAARFFYAMRSCEQHLAFDLELAKSTKQDNPVYYVQYAHARICSVFKKMTQQNMIWDKATGRDTLALLTLDNEQKLMKLLADYPHTIQLAAKQQQPHYLTQFLQSLAREFHSYYNAHKVLSSDEQLRHARLYLSKAVQQVLANGLTLLGVASPEQM